MNVYLKSQIKNMTEIANAFKNACQLAATQDDGQISKEEAKALSKINKATERFIKEISAVNQEKP